MKSLTWLILPIVSLLLISGCSDKSFSPLESDNNVSQSPELGLNKKGPVVHSVEGSGLTSLDGKNLGARYTAHEYADGTFDGEYLINSANATGDPTFKWNGNVLKFKIYEDVGTYGGKMAVFLGQEKTGAFSGWYDVFFAIDNGKPGQTEAPDQVNYMIVGFPSLDYVSVTFGLTIEGFYNMEPDELIGLLGTMDCDKGNVVIK